MSNQQTQSVEILLVEDDSDDALLTMEALKDSKIANHVSVVSDGLEAMSFLRREGKYAASPRPDLILLDLNMPKMDGREVLAEVKKDPHLMDIPIVILTTSGAEQDILKSYRLHANCFITKPVDLEQFSTVVKTVENFWFNVVKLPRSD